MAAGGKIPRRRRHDLSAGARGEVDGDDCGRREAGADAGERLYGTLRGGLTTQAQRPGPQDA